VTRGTSFGYDATLVPTIPTTHIPADWDPTVDDAEVIDGDERFHRIVGALFTMPFKFLNRFPVASVPAGISKQNMPIGMQIIGKPYDTETVFCAAWAFSRGGPRLFTGGPPFSRANRHGLRYA
jgi:Asp-tRNA(Asn)/Glu-tRNA(Gln) amidotransferase A subunit family amidase